MLFIAFFARKPVRGEQLGHAMNRENARCSAGCANSLPGRKVLNNYSLFASTLKRSSELSTYRTTWAKKFLASIVWKTQCQ